MKNLKLLYLEKAKHNLQNLQKVSLSVFGEVHCLCSEKQVYLVKKDGKGDELITAFDEPVTDLEFVALNNELCVATEGGSVFLEQAGGKREEVTFCEDGIERMSFSPDQEVVVFVTRTKRVVTMNCNFDPLNEVSLLDESFGDKEFITVGWGKKETQFAGTAAKKAALEALKAQENALRNVEASSDVKECVSWREDGEYFAVLFTCPKNGRRFKVFDKEGSLQYTSEKCVGLGAVLSWRPSGNWIAVPQVLPNKYVIALFEKNGLRHREVELPFAVSDEEVVGLSWSNDSDILLVQTQKAGASTSSLYLFTISNYKWYLKQTLNFDCSIVSSKWDPNPGQKKTLHLFSSDGSHLTYCWDHVVSRSLGRDSTDEGIVAVIDGRNLLLTALRNTVVPPPMSNFQLVLPHPVNFVAFCPKVANELLVIDSLNQIHVVECKFTDQSPRRLVEAEVKRTLSFKVNEATPLGLYHFSWVAERALSFVDSSNIFHSVLEDDNEVGVLKVLPQDGGKVNNLATSEESLFLSTTSGNVSCIKDEFSRIEKVFELPEACTSLAVDASGNHVVARKNGALYLDQARVTDEATSFVVFEGYLLYTTFDELRFVELQSRKEVFSRKLERGSTIVLAVPETSRVILQLPRGNLETINPRFLSLKIIQKLLDALEYGKAFEVLRKERFNLNLLVDHDPVVFKASTETFVEKIGNIQWLNLFIADLQDVDTTQVWFKSNYEKRSLDMSSKTSEICALLARIFEQRDEFVLPLITCFVKIGNVQGALSKIWSLKAREDGREADEAFKYLLYLVDVNELFNVALGMYDFGLVLFVGKRSQKDPKEYVPFLQELEALEENYRKFKIDCHLKRFASAVSHICRCGGEERLEESLKVVRDHGLFAVALEGYEGQNEEAYRRVALAYGDRLREKKMLTEASVMYERGGDLQSALNCARNALSWQRYLSLLRQSGSSQEEFEDLVRRIVAALQEAGRHSEAAMAVKSALNDPRLYVEVCLRGHLYSEAILESNLGGLGVAEEIRESLVSYLGQLTTSLESDESQFRAQTLRLKAVREEKQQRELHEGGFEDNAESDLFSDTSSMNSSARYSSSSGGSKKSFKSSKNRRKHEKKLLNLKEGNKFEDIALIDSLYKLALKTFSGEQQRHVHEVLTASVELRLEKVAVTLQATYSRLMNVIKDSLNDIWIRELVVPDEVDLENIEDFSKLRDFQHYAMIKTHQRFKPTLTKIDWELEVLRRY